MHVKLTVKFFSFFDWKTKSYESNKYKCTYSTPVNDHLLTKLAMLENALLWDHEHVGCCFWVKMYLYPCSFLIYIYIYIIIVSIFNFTFLHTVFKMLCSNWTIKYLNDFDMGATKCDYIFQIIYCILYTLHNLYM